MNPGIFLIQNNEELVEMNQQQYDSDDYCKIGWRNIRLLVGNQIDVERTRKDFGAWFPGVIGQTAKARDMKGPNRRSQNPKFELKQMKPPGDKDSKDRGRVSNRPIQKAPAA